MTRLFDQHVLRRVTALDGLWDFAFLGDVDPDTVNPATLTFDDRLPVPACFDATPNYAGKRGLAAYHLTFTVEESPRHRLVFDTVHHWCRVFVDGSPLTDHVGGFTTFNVDLEDLRAGSHELVVLVDNRIDYKRTPLHLDYFDWYHYGGISGSVQLHHLPVAWIDRVTITTERLDPPTVNFAVTYNCSSGDAVPVTLAVDGVVLIDDETTLQAEGGTLEYRLELTDAALWSPDTPNLHQVAVRLGSDDLRERFGIRTVAAQDGQILINGESVRLLGFNRHHSHPQFGCTLPQNVNYADLMQMRDLGCNFVRGSHYPQDRGFLDLCDELGFLVWVESIGWQHTASHLTDPHFMNAQHTHITEMIAMSENHPSVFLWGILNEGQSHDPRTRDGYAALLTQIREADPTRPVTYASNHPFDDVCLDLVDVISINTYPGWYIGELAELGSLLDSIIEHIDSHGHADKPFIIAEIGAGAIYGWRDGHNARWSEGYQTALLEAVIDSLFISGKRACGLAIWQFCDIRTAENAAKAIRRPRSFNNKGIVDEYRRPKEAYRVVKALFAGLKS